MKYAIGDSMEVYPRNNPSHIEEFCSQYKSLGGIGGSGVEGRTVVTVKGHPALPDGEMSVGVIFGVCLDLFGKPSRKFFGDLLSIFETSLTADPDATHML